MIKIRIFLLTATLMSQIFGLKAQTSYKKEIKYLSGADVKHTKTWDFMVTGGRKSGKWSTIQVPSHWEQQGFGNYNYGRDGHTFGKNFKYADEQGLYKHRFTVPAGWKGRQINLVFEGSMTDTKVTVNGQLAGKVHQGAFYRFQYDVSDKVKYGSENLLEVTVSKMSSEKTINNAERFADFWIFGGIFRPVYLESVPQEHISWTAIDAKASGDFRMDVHANRLKPGRVIIAKITGKDGKVVGTASAVAKKGDTVITLTTKVTRPELWTAETPALYKTTVAINAQGKAIYETAEKFGFRTIEVRKQDGIYVNGSKIKIKGVNRHVFWPEYGRATFPEGDLTDVRTIKDMNMNAVRCSHYPPDQNFLKLCDSLGLYVVDELAGWQNAYSTNAGRPLVKEMVIRDKNHPSIIFWSNGNEGGHNKDFDNDFRKYDISNRTVIHAHHKPGNAINGIDCNHYEDYYSTEKILRDTNIYMPTEFMHAMHDGGGAAGLYDMWELHWNSKKGAGGFIWDLADEGIVRTDQNDQIDVDGVNAADGVVGPHREREGSFNAIREIYSPVRIELNEIAPDFSGQIPVENRYNFQNLNSCRFEWELLKFNRLRDENVSSQVIKNGMAKAPDVLPTQKGTLALELPADWKHYDALALRVKGADGREIYRWVWKISANSILLKELTTGIAGTEVKAVDADSLATLKAAGVSIGLSKRTGQLVKAANESGQSFSFNNGPVLVSGSSSFKSLKVYKDGDDQVAEVQYTGDLTQVNWRMKPNGWVELSYEYQSKGKVPFAGISFSYPEGLVTGAKWLGKGPFRVWKNRMQGVNYDVFQSRYNNTQTGRAPWTYPEFKGYYADVVWMQLSTMEGNITFGTPGQGLFVRLFEFYAINANKPHPQLPAGDISFLEAIPAVGSKMGINPANVAGFGPLSGLNVINGGVKRTLYFYFGTPKLNTMQ